MPRIATTVTFAVMLGFGTSIVLPLRAVAQTPGNAPSAIASTVDAGGYVAPYNLVIVNLDASVSFQIPSKEEGLKGRVLSTEALTVVQQLFRDGAKQRQRRTDGIDRYVLVAVDAASQVIWRGTRDELRQVSPGVLASMLTPRRQFAGCTDLGAAFIADLAEIRRESRATNVFVLTFSDLVNEPPTTGWNTCAAPSGEPPSVSWKDFSNAALGFYFVSTNFTLRPAARWAAALEADGLQPVFLDAAQTMSNQLELTPPVAATYRPSADDVRQANDSLDRLKGGLQSTANTVALGTAAVISGLIVWVVTAARRRRPRTV